MQAWLAYQVEVEDQRIEADAYDEARANGGGGQVKGGRRKVMTDREFFEVSGIRPEPYPFLMSERLKREGKL